MKGEVDRGVQLGFLADVLQRRLQAAGDDADKYLARLAANSPRKEIAALAQELTIAETYFFRNFDQFRALREVVFPDRMRAQEARKSLRILSAGCASGEEAYSIAILLRESVADPSWNVSIRAVDINPAILRKAERASYSTWALRETSPELQRRWFRSCGREIVLDDRIRDAVKFEERNLTDENSELWETSFYDIIFCRNVMIYFSPETAQSVVARLARALVPGGYLFLGHAETLRNLSQDFHLLHTHETFYYQRKDGSEIVGPPLPLHARAVRAGALALGNATAGPGDWIDAIGRASERIEALARPPMQTALAAPMLSPGVDIQEALDLLLAERFEEALDRLGAFSPASTKDADVLLLRAVLQTQRGQLADAEATCHRLLQIDELSAGAHYVLALCCESSQDRAGAAEHDRVAVYLDPTFAMPRLHLGLLARRADERECARRELEQARTLLRREDASRLLLFGGGFSRDALITLCESALRDCGGQA